MIHVFILTFSSHTSLLLLDILFKVVSINSTAYQGETATGTIEFLGNKTECALLNLNKHLGCDYKPLRDNADVIELIPFTSKRKAMATIVHEKGVEMGLKKDEKEGKSGQKEGKSGQKEGENGQNGHKMDQNNQKTDQKQQKHDQNDHKHHYVAMVKGASESILEYCSSELMSDGSVVALKEERRKEWEVLIEEMAGEALRTIALAYRCGKREWKSGRGGVERKRRGGSGNVVEKWLSIVEYCCSMVEMMLK